jgi:transcriptional regulator NrdR family protein
MNSYIYKRSHRTEPYDTFKLQRSIKSTCLSVRTPPGEAELTAQRVAKSVESWLERRPEVTSADIRRKASEYLKVYNPEASYLFVQHRIMA